MTAASWACTALLCWHLNFTGALPREVHIDQVRAHAAGQRPVRVLIFNNVSRITLRPQVTVAIEDPRAREHLATVLAGAQITLSQAAAGIAVQGPGIRVTASEIRILPLTDDGGAIISSRGGSGRRGLYPGALHVASTSGGLRVVEHLGLEAYMAGVLAAEMPSYFPLEAMKAQAVAARTYTLQHLGDHADDGADLCARVHCQAYAGIPPPDSPAAQAVRQTAGQVLSYHGILIDALYHSACGGATAPAWEVRQGKLLPYLCGAEDTPSSELDQPYCARDHDVAWTTRFSWQQAERLISSNLGAVLGRPELSPGTLESLRIVNTRNTERVAWLDVSASEGTYRVRGDAIRWLFGTGRPGAKGLRSTAFALELEEDTRRMPRALILQGAGHGHGIGLCQWGARGRALAGQTAREILAAYYPGAIVTDLRR